MNRTQLLSKYGVTKGVTQGMWSFVNHLEKKVIFGGWSYNYEPYRIKILDTEWILKKDDTKSGGYSTAIKHLKLLDNGYQLYVFMQEPHSGKGSRIGKVHDNLECCVLKQIGTQWFAYRNTYHSLPDEINPHLDDEEYFEGSRTSVLVNAYERSTEARGKCIAFHGTICKACAFDFEKVYGEHGKGFIHVHHIIPLNQIGKRYKVNPETDLIPLCPNCHAMVHRFKNKQLDIDTLKSLITICRK